MFEGLTVEIAGTGSRCAAAKLRRMLGRNYVTCNCPPCCPPCVQSLQCGVGWRVGVLLRRACPGWMLPCCHAAWCQSISSVCFSAVTCAHLSMLISRGGTTAIKIENGRVWILQARFKPSSVSDTPHSAVFASRFLDLDLLSTRLLALRRWARSGS